MGSEFSSPVFFAAAFKIAVVIYRAPLYSLQATHTLTQAATVCLDMKKREGLYLVVINRRRVWVKVASCLLSFPLSPLLGQVGERFSTWCHSLRSNMAGDGGDGMPPVGLGEGPGGHFLA